MKEILTVFRWKFRANEPFDKSIVAWVWVRKEQKIFPEFQLRTVKSC